MKKYVQLEFNFLPWDDEEIWKDIPYLKGKYQISNLHNIRSWIDSHGNRRKEPKILKQWLNHNGYPQVCLHNNGKQEVKLVHRLMWLTWVGEIPEGMQINHISEYKTENRLENLNLMTCKENSNWGTRNERIGKANSIALKNHKLRSKSVIQKSLDGEIIKIWPSAMEIQRQLGYSFGSICNCCRGGYFDKRREKWINVKQSHGFIWQYTDKAAS